MLFHSLFSIFSEYEVSWNLKKFLGLFSWWRVSFCFWNYFHLIGKPESKWIWLNLMSVQWLQAYFQGFTMTAVNCTDFNNSFQNQQWVLSLRTRTGVLVNKFSRCLCNHFIHVIHSTEAFASVQEGWKHGPFFFCVGMQLCSSCPWKTTTIDIAFGTKQHCLDNNMKFNI